MSTEIGGNIYQQGYDPNEALLILEHTRKWAKIGETQGPVGQIAVWQNWQPNIHRGLLYE